MGPSKVNATLQTDEMNLIKIKIFLKAFFKKMKIAEETFVITHLTKIL